MTDPFIQESTPVTIAITNTTASNVLVPDPETENEMIALQVTDKVNGKSKRYSSATFSQRYDPHYLSDPEPAVKQLKPGEKAVLQFGLLSWVETLNPGQYTLQAFLGSDDRALRSNIVDLTARRAKLGTMRFTEPSSTLEKQWHSVWTHQESDGSMIASISDWTFEPVVSVKNSMRIGKISSAVQPAISTMPNKMWNQGSWIAWIDGRSLTFAYAHPTKLLLEPYSVPLPADEAKIFPSVFHAAAMDESPGEGSMMIHHVDGQSRAQILCLSLTPKFKAESSYKLPVTEGASIRWMTTVFLSDAHRRGMWIAQHASEAHLMRVEWPMDGKPNLTPAHQSWAGSLVAATATLNLDDVIFGATLMWTGSDADVNAALKLYRWKIGAEGKFEQLDAKVVEWEPDREIVDAKIAANKAGEVVALLKNKEGQWKLLNPDGDVSDPPPIIPTADVIDIFYAKKNLPLVTFSDPNGAFKFYTLNGDLYPQW
ncbi:MAG: hypothetical protein ABFS39_11990 [Pseudomonadota bacterium]